MIDSAGIWKDIAAIRRQAPLVHSVTNLVVMDITANALLALGASPVMAHAPQEVQEMTALAGALVLNIGTLDDAWIGSMLAALKAAHASGKPVVFDPVGAGATRFRTETAQRILAAGGISVIRGNASEIATLAGATGRTKGVDSLEQPLLVAAAATGLLDRCHAIAISGQTDIVMTRNDRLVLGNGCAMMTKVTGMGCTATALVGAFLAVQADPFQATAHAMAVMGIAGEIARDASDGPGSLRLHFLDALYNLDEKTIAARLRVE
jgi:hydroxyethylthiazole kinase